MSEIEGDRSGSVENGGGSGEVSSSSEVSETSANETGGESSEATQEATTEEAGESGGFDENTDTTESPADSAEDYEESDSEEESDDSQEVGFSEGDPAENVDSQYDDTDYDNDDTSSGDEDGVGFDDFGDDVSDGTDEEADSEPESSDSHMDEDNDESVDEPNDYDDDSSGYDWYDQENDEDLGETEDYSNEEALDDNTDDGDNIDDVQDDDEAQTEVTNSNADGNEADGDMNNDGEPDDVENETEANTEDGDDIDYYDEDEDPGELEEYFDEETLDDGTEDGDDIDEAQDDGEAQTENTDNSNADGDKADGDTDNDSDPDSTETGTEAGTKNGDGVDDVQDDNEVQTENVDSNADGDGANGDMDNDSDPDSSEADTEDSIEDVDDVQDDGEAKTEDGDVDDYDEDEDPGELEEYSDEDSENRNEEDESTDDSDSERKQAEKEQAAEEENKEAADRAENETENADVENAGKNVDDVAESENRNPSESIAEQQTEPAETEGNDEVDTENDTSRIGENDNNEAHTDFADNNEDNSIDIRDQNDERPKDEASKMAKNAENSDNKDAYYTAINNMTEYMSEHNYGPDDYSEYSKDPEWYKLNSELQQSMGKEVTPPTPEVAMSNMTDYMNEHNYGPDDYSEYSKDPEWYKLNSELQQSMGMEITTGISTPSPESGKDVSATELPDNCVMVNASDIDMTYAQGMDSDQFWNHHGNTKEDYMRMAERIPDVQQALDSGKSLDEIKQDPELKDTAHAYFDPENMIKVEQQFDGGYSYTDNGRHRIAAAQELGYEILVEVTNKSENFSAENNLDPNSSKELIEGMAYTQGNNELGYERTCGPTSLANSLNRVMDTNKFTENDIVKTAADNKLCCTSGSPENCGGTSTSNIVELVDKVTTHEDNITTEVYEYGNALSVDELADKLKDSNTVAMVGVDSSTLWDARGDVTNSSLFSNVESDYSDHWIMVDKPVYGEDGELKGFKIVDSGGGESFVDRDKFEAMYIGNDDFQVKDPTSIIFSKAAPNAGDLDTDVQPQEAPSQKDSLFIVEEMDLPPPETGEADKNADRNEIDFEIPTKDISDMPENVQRSYGQYEGAGWPNVPKLPEQTPGTHASGTWQNRNGDLPRTTPDGTPITYRKHDVNNKNPGSTRDAQRFVTGSDGSVYYTDDHYSTFTKLK